MPLQLLTKGDVRVWLGAMMKISADRMQNNAADDTELYAKGQNYLNREEDVIGSVVGYVPLVSLVTRLNNNTVLITNAGWLCDDIIERIPMAENGHDSVHGLDSRTAKRMSKPHGEMA